MIQPETQGLRCDRRFFEYRETLMAQQHSTLLASFAGCETNIWLAAKACKVSVDIYKK